MVSDHVRRHLPHLRRSSPGGEVRRLPRRLAAPWEPPRPDPAPGGQAAPRPCGLRYGGGAAAIAPPDQTEDDAPTVEDLARGVASVDRAVRRFRQVQQHPPIYRIPPPVVTALGWQECAECGAALEKGAGIILRGELLHPQCAIKRLRAAA